MSRPGSPRLHSTTFGDNMRSMLPHPRRGGIGGLP
jgi:hypothetical protein